MLVHNVGTLLFNYMRVCYLQSKHFHTCSNDTATHTVAHLINKTKSCSCKLDRTEETLQREQN